MGSASQYENPDMTNSVDLIDLEVSQPTCFYTWLGDAWRQGPISPLIRRGTTLHFEFFDSEFNEWEPTTVMALEDDGLYHFRDGKEHHWGFWAETKTHIYLTGNFINSDGTQGVEIYIWPIVEKTQERGAAPGKKAEIGAKVQLKKAQKQRKATKGS
jgi:hypothetical protein